MPTLFEYQRRLYDMFRCDNGEPVDMSCSKDMLSLTMKVNGRTYNLTMTEEEEEDD